MPRIKPVHQSFANAEAKALLDGVEAQFGMVPNILATFAQSPKVLDGFLALSPTSATRRAFRLI